MAPDEKKRCPRCRRMVGIEGGRMRIHGPDPSGDFFCAGSKAAGGA